MKYLGSITDNFDLVNKKYVDDNDATKQDTLVSGTNIKTINNQSILGSGNIDIQGGQGQYLPLTGGTLTGTLNGTIINASGNLTGDNLKLALNTSATSGDDKDIYDALVALGWTDCIE